VAAAWKKAQRIAADEGEILPQVFKMEGDQITDIVQVPSMKAWDYIKRGLDDVVEGFTDDFGRIKGHEGMVANDLRKNLNSVLEEMNPAWKQAKQIWSSKSRLEKAMETGRKAFSEDVDLTARQLRKMSPEDMEMLRIGAANALKTKINKMGDQHDIAKKVWGNPDIRSKLKLLFPDERKYRKFAADVMREAKKHQTKGQVLGNSVTGRLEAEKADMAFDPTFLAALGRGDLGQAAASGMRFLANRASVPSRGFSEEMADRLFTVDPAQQQELLRRLAMSQMPGADRRWQMTSGGMFGGLSTLPSMFGAD
jgi:hypothetical protein